MRPGVSEKAGQSRFRELLFATVVMSYNDGKPRLERPVYMPRISITRDGRRIGFLETSGRRPEERRAELPGLEGDDSGFAIVTEVANSPVAALIFPYDGESIEIGQIVRWLPEGKTPPRDVARLSDESAVLQLAGDLRVSSDGEQFSVDFRTERRSQRETSGDVSFQLEINDEDNRGYIRCDFRGEPKLRKGGLRGTFYGVLQSEGRVDYADADFRFDLFAPFGEGEFYGRIRSLAEGQSGAGEFRFEFDFFGQGRGYGEGRFRGNAPEFPGLWLIQETVNHARSERRVPFRIWIGELRYARESVEARLARRQVAELLARGSSLTESDVLHVCHWLAQAIPRTENPLFYRRALSPLLERFQVPEKTTRISRREFGITFDDSLSAEKALDFLVALGEELANASGRLCFAQGQEDE